MNAVRQFQAPLIEIDKTHLDFGTLDLDKGQLSVGQVTLLIKNSGGGVLAGRIIPQFAWVEVNPAAFQLSAGQSSEFNVSLTPETPKSGKWSNVAKENLLFINSNGGALSVGGSYLSPPVNIDRTSIPPRQMIISIAAVLLIFAMVLFGGVVALGRRPVATPNYVDMLYTQGAGTVIAQLSATVGAEERESGSVSTIVVHIGAVTDAGQPTEAQEGVPIPTATFTPWPRADYPNPEQFVTSYYESLNSRNYEETWSNLTSEFQKNCCSIAGNNPFLVYVNWWDSVERVEVQSAYIQDWNANPAIVHVQVNYYYRKGGQDEIIHIVEVVLDDESQSLKIDQVW
jgi:hypothetical protein